MACRQRCTETHDSDPSAKRAKSRGRHLEQLRRQPMVHAEFTRQGFATAAVDTLTAEVTELFAMRLMRCFDSWYRSHLPPHLRGEQRLRITCSSLKETELRLYDLMDSVWRKKHLTPDESKAVRFALNGGTMNAQGTSWRGWRLSGFGVPSNLRGLQLAVRSIATVGKATAEMLRCETVVSGGLPGNILKPGHRDGRLASHIDQGSLCDMFVLCRRLVREGKCEAEHWMRRVGVQTLVHWYGARDSDPGGHTVTLAHLSVRRYLTLLCMFHPDHPHPAALASYPKNALGNPSADPEAVDSGKTQSDVTFKPGANSSVVQAFMFSGGPVPVDFFRPSLLEALNAALMYLEHGSSIPPASPTSAWIASLRAAGRLNDITPSTMGDRYAPRRAAPCVAGGSVFVPVVEERICPKALGSKGGGAYLLGWLRGFPHRVIRTKGKPRGSFVTKLRECPATLQELETLEAERCRSVHRMRLLLRGEYASIEADSELSRPFAGGGVHRRPNSELALHRDFFAPVYATLVELDEFDRITSSWYESAKRTFLSTEAK